MKKLCILLVAFVVVTLSSCKAIEGLLKIGFAAGIIVVLVVIFLIVWLISAFKGRE